MLFPLPVCVCRGWGGGPRVCVCMWTEAHIRCLPQLLQDLLLNLQITDLTRLAVQQVLENPSSSGSPELRLWATPVLPDVLWLWLHEPTYLRPFEKCLLTRASHSLACFLLFYCLNIWSTYLFYLMGSLPPPLFLSHFVTQASLNLPGWPQTLDPPISVS